MNNLKTPGVIFDACETMMRDGDLLACAVTFMIFATLDSQGLQSRRFADFILKHKEFTDFLLSPEYKPGEMKDATNFLNALRFAANPTKDEPK